LQLLGSRELAGPGSRELAGPSPLIIAYQAPKTFFRGIIHGEGGKPNQNFLLKTDKREQLFTQNFKTFQDVLRYIAIIYFLKLGIYPSSGLFLDHVF
jgi:hypothetical protein